MERRSAKATKRRWRHRRLAKTADNSHFPTHCGSTAARTRRTPTGHEPRRRWVSRPTSKKLLRVVIWAASRGTWSQGTRWRTAAPRRPRAPRHHGTQRRRGVRRYTCRCRACGERTTLRSLPAPYKRSKVTCEWLAWFVLHSATSKHIVAGPASEDPKYMPMLAELGQAGQFKPIIDSSYPFEAIVDAHRRVDSHHKRGSVVVRIE